MDGARSKRLVEYMRSIVDIPEYDKNLAKEIGKCDDRDIIQIAAVTGHHTGKGSTVTRSIIYKDDFYTFTPIDQESCYGIRGKSSPNNWKFNTEEEASNFLSYIRSFAARFFISLVKTDAHLDSGQLNYIPAVDFTKQWTDEELYEHFGFSHELIEYIEEFLGDYYDRINNI